MSASFPLAPMDGLVRGLTAVMLLLPVVFLGAALVQPPVALVALALGVLYAGIWLFLRPGEFRLDEAGLHVVRPLRASAVPWSSITGAEQLDRAGFKERYRWAMRVGAGGLWGGFGLAVTGGPTFQLYVSRVDRYVVVHTKPGTRPLLLTPSEPGRFVEEVRARCGR